MRPGRMFPLYPATAMGDRMCADIPEPRLDPPDDDEGADCKECGLPWTEHRRTEEYDAECPDPEDYVGRWVGHWPEDA